MEKERKDIFVFGYGLGAIAGVFAFLGTLRHGFGFFQAVELVCALVFIIVTFVNWQALKPGYKIWMKGAHFIGGIVTTGILGAVFFLVFAPIGVFFWYTKKDHLNRTIDKNAPTYWIPRSEGLSQKERYRQQF